LVIYLIFEFIFSGLFLTQFNGKGTLRSFSNTI